MKTFVVTFRFDSAQSTVREVSFKVTDVASAIQAINTADDMLRFFVSGNYAGCLKPSSVSTFSI